MSEGSTLRPAPTPERDLRDYLVIVFHADEDDAECIAADVFKNPPVPVSDGGGDTWYPYDGDELAVSVARCNVAMKDLWKVREGGT